MNFIEPLKSVGGVKPCPECDGKGKKHRQVREGDGLMAGTCFHCHGTGQILDLAPLLARPDLLLDPVHELLVKADLWRSGIRTLDKRATGYIVGPQRAHSLVYEIARQLGGTAVVAEQIVVDDITAELRLSLPIPDSDTVLFVTDRADEQEIREISRASGVSVTKVLPHLLALIGRTGDILTAECTCGAGMGSVSLRIISLHSENS